jgi:2'-5' RNA ligase
MANAATATETAVIIPIDAVEPAVAEHRRQLDVAASWGVPAHVSVLYPFVHPSAIDDDVISRLASALVSVPAFDCTFARCDWFGEEVLWLAPEPDGPFRALTSAVWRVFPDYPPYGGVFDDVVPHLTVGDRRRGSASALQAAAATVSQQLPIRARIDWAVLIAGTAEPNSWHSVHEFRLPAPAG